MEQKYTIHYLGNPESETVLVQMTAERSEEDQVVRLVRELAGRDEFCLMSVQVPDWNADLSPWAAPAVYGHVDFAGKGTETLNFLESVLEPERRYFIGGYSLAGLFALWSIYQTDRFSGAAAASPSVWYPGFTEYMKNNQILCRQVYLSLGDREEKTRHPVMSKVGDCIRSGFRILEESGVICQLEWNPGNHFQDPALRTAKAFAWLLKNDSLYNDRQ